MPRLGTFPKLCISLGTVAACTWLALHFRLNLAAMGFFYLILVITAVLDSLAHQIKTPVATISAASSGLMASEVRRRPSRCS